MVKRLHVLNIFVERTIFYGYNFVVWHVPVNNKGKQKITVK